MYLLFLITNIPLSHTHALTLSPISLDVLDRLAHFLYGVGEDKLADFIVAEELFTELHEKQLRVRAPPLPSPPPFGATGLFSHI